MTAWPEDARALGCSGAAYESARGPGPNRLLGTKSRRAPSGIVEGWLPNYLLDEVHGYLDAGRDVWVTVERANGPEVPAHIRRQYQLVVNPPRPEAS